MGGVGVGWSERGQGKGKTDNKELDTELVSESIMVPFLLLLIHYKTMQTIMYGCTNLNSSNVVSVG